MPDYRLVDQRRSRMYNIGILKRGPNNFGARELQSDQVKDKTIGKFILSEELQRVYVVNVLVRNEFEPS